MTRYVCWGLIGILVLLLAGCGGGGGSPLIGDQTLVGNWLDIAPYGAGGSQPNNDGYTPTRELDLHADGSLAFEEYTADNSATGAYSAGGSTLSFSNIKNMGYTQFFAQGAASYAFLNNALTITMTTSADNSRAYQFSRILNVFPAPLVNEWLAVQRSTSNGALLAQPDSAHWVVAQNGDLEITRYRLQTQQLTTEHGHLFITQSAHLGLQLTPGTNITGGLFLLGAYQTDTGVFAYRAPDGTVTLYYAISAPSLDLLGSWKQLNTQTPSTLTIGSDGKYTLTDSTNAVTNGLWRTYGQQYIALTSANSLRTLAWNVVTTAASTQLQLYEWQPAAGGQYAYVQTLWAKQP